VVNALMENRLDGFRPNFASRGTWLKPGVNETKRAERHEWVLRQSPLQMDFLKLKSNRFLACQK